jgi:hypothetical protein
VHSRLTADLVARAGLDRELEVLPSADGFAALEAAGAGLTSPELATLLAHTKLDLTAQVLATDLPDIKAFAGRLPEYFPHAVRERFAGAVEKHPLRREIVTTMLVNEMVDGAGMTYAFRLGEELSAGPADAARAEAARRRGGDRPVRRHRAGSAGGAAAAAARAGARVCGDEGGGAAGRRDRQGVRAALRRADVRLRPPRRRRADRAGGARPRAARAA